MFYFMAQDCAVIPDCNGTPGANSPVQEVPTARTGYGARHRESGSACFMINKSWSSDVVVLWHSRPLTWNIADYSTH